MEKTIKYLENGEYHYATVKDVGDLAKLKTTSKDTLVDAINDLFANGGSYAGKPDGYDKLVDQVADTIQKQQDISGKIDDAQKAVDAAQKAIDTNKADTDEGVKALQEAQAEARKNLEAMKKEQAAIQKQFNDAVTELNNSVTDLDQKTSNLRENVNTKMASLQKDVDTVHTNLDNESKALNKELGDTKSDLETAKSKILEHTDELGKVNKSVADLEDKIDSKIEKAELDSVREQITKNSTDITQTKDELKSKADQTNLDLVTNSVEKLDTQVKQNASGIEMTVKKDELAGQVSNLLNDKTNLLLGTRDFSGDSWSNKNNWKEEPGYWNGKKVWSSTDQWSGLQYTYTVKKGEIYTFSFDAKQDKDNPKAEITLTKTNLGDTGDTDRYHQTTHITTEWARYFMTFKALKDATIYPRVEQNVKDNKLYVAGYKLELGATATPWEPNEADVAEQIEHNESDFKVQNEKIEGLTKKQEQIGKTQTDLETKVTQTAEGVEQNSKKLVNADGKISELDGKIKSTAEGLKTDYESYTNKAIGEISDSSLNLIRNSAFSDNDDSLTEWQNISSKVNVIEDSNGLHWAEITQSTNSGAQGLTSNYFEIKQGKITVAVDIRLGTKAKLANSKVLLLEVYDQNKKRVDFKEVTLENLGLSLSAISDGNVHRGLIRYANDRQDAKYMTVKAEINGIGDLLFTNFSAKLSSIDNGDYTPNPDDVNQQIIKQNTKIEQNAKDISLKASSADVTRTVEQVNQSISDSASALNDKVDNIKIGGTNVLRNTDPTDDLLKGSITGTSWVVGSAGNGTGATDVLGSPFTATRYFRLMGNTIQQNKDFNQRPVNWTNSKYVFSVYARIDPGSGVSSLTAYIRSFSTKQGKALFQNNFTVDSKEWKRFTFDIDGSALYQDDTASFAFGIFGRGSVDFAEPMLVTGTKAMDWSPNPNDINSKVDDTATTLRKEITSAKDAAIKVSSDSIDEHVNELKKTYDEKLNTQINEAKSASQKFTSDGIEQTVKKITEVQTNVKNLGDTVSSNQSDLSKQIKDTNNKVNKNKQDSESRDKNLQNDINDTNKQITTLKTETSASVKNLGDRVTTEVKSITKKITDTNDKIDGIQVGGRNLLRNSGNFKNLDHWKFLSNGVKDTSMGLNTHVFWKNGAENLLTINNVSTTTEVSAQSDNFDVKPNTTYTISFWGFHNANIMSYDLFFLGRKYGSTKNFDVAIQPIAGKALDSGKAIYVTVSFNTGDTNEGHIRFDNNGSKDGQNACLYLTDIKVEEGNKATDWTPAPEDTEETIKSINTKLDVANGQIEGKVSETDVNNILNGKGYATQDWAQSQFRMKSDSIDLEVKKITDPIVKEITVNKNDLDKRISNTDSRVSDVNNLVSSNSGGGVNLLTNTHDYSRNWTFDNIGHSVSGNVLTLTNNNGTNSRIYQGLPVETSKKVFSLSFYAKINPDCKDKDIKLRIGPYDALNEVHVTSTDSQLYKLENWTWNGTSTTFSFYVDNGKVDIAKLKLEYGYKATPYTPSPDDTVSYINGLQTQVDKNKIDSEARDSKLSGDIDNSTKTLRQEIQTSKDAAIKVFQDKIDLKVSEADVNTLLDEKKYVTQDWAQANIQMKKDAITLEAVKQQVNDGINNIQIGGRNYISPKNITGINSSISYDESSGIWTMQIANGAGGSWGAGPRFGKSKLEIPWGQSYTESIEVYVVDDRLTWNVDINTYSVNGTNWSGNDNDNVSVRSYSPATQSILPKNQWTRVSFTASNSHSKNTDHIAIYDQSNFGIVNNTGKTVTVKFRYPKQELGSKATDYSPNPDDTANEIAQLKVANDGINASVQDVNNSVQSINDKVDTQTLESANIDNMKTQGHYFVHNLTGNPIGGWVFVDVTGNNKDRIRQDVYRDTGNEHAYRVWNGTWSNWDKIASQSWSSSNFQMKKDAITLEVVKEAASGGGVNLLTGTADFSGDNWNVHRDDGGWTRSGVDDLGNTAYKKSGHAWEGLGQLVYVEAGQYTFSMHVWLDLADNQSADVYGGDDNQYGSTAKADVTKVHLTSKAPQKQWFTYAVAVNVTKAGKLVIRPELNQDGGTICVGSYKLEKGLVSSPWSPAPTGQDLVSKINITPEKIRLSSDKIEIDGNTYIHGTLNVPDVKLQGKSGIIGLDGDDGILISSADTGFQTKINKYGMDFLTKTSGHKEIMGGITTAGIDNNMSLNGISIVLDTQQILGDPYGGDFFSIGKTTKKNSDGIRIFSTAMQYDASGNLFGGGFRWTEPSTLTGDGRKIVVDGAHDPLWIGNLKFSDSTQNGFYQPTIGAGWNDQTKGDSGISFLWNSIKPYGKMDMRDVDIWISGAEDVMKFSYVSWNDWTAKIPCLLRPTKNGDGGIAFGSDGNVILFGSGRRKDLFHM